MFSINDRFPLNRFDSQDPQLSAPDAHLALFLNYPLLPRDILAQAYPTMNILFLFSLRGHLVS